MEKPSTVLLSDAEIREGLDRLMSTALMHPENISEDKDGFSFAGDVTGTFKLNVGLPPSELMEAYGVDRQTACVIFDLAVALVSSRLSRAEIFTLGTSEEAMRFFEAECSEWNNPPRAAFDSGARL